VCVQASTGTAGDVPMVVWILSGPRTLRSHHARLRSDIACWQLLRCADYSAASLEELSSLRMVDVHPHGKRGLSADVADPVGAGG
jgi:hypothetical protein